MNCDYSNLFNFDETGVNYENVPSKTWVPTDVENYKVKTKVRNINYDLILGNPDLRITVGLACTASGLKLEP